MEQLNIEGKRSGKGFIAHKTLLVDALSRALSDRVQLVDFTIGRRGLLNYLKAVGGSNIVKIVPSNGGASDKQTTAKKLKIICGHNTSYLEQTAWIGDKTPLTICELRISPNNIVKPNISTIELAEAFSRVVPFVATDENRQSLQKVLFSAEAGKLTLVSADGFRMAIVSLDCDGLEGKALIDGTDLKSVITAIKKARRAKVSFTGEDVQKRGSLNIDTELVSYKFVSYGGDYPDYQKLIPNEFSTIASFDTIEAIKAINSIKIVSSVKDYPLDIVVSDSLLTMTDPDDKGLAMIPANTSGEAKIRVNGRYLLDVLKAYGSMVDLNIANAYSPMLFSRNGYKVVVMPMLTDKANDQAKKDREAEAKPKAEAKVAIKA